MTDDHAFEVFARTEIESRAGRIAALQAKIEGALGSWQLVLVEGAPDKDFVFRLS